MPPFLLTWFLCYVIIKEKERRKNIGRKETVQC